METPRDAVALWIRGKCAGDPDHKLIIVKKGLTLEEADRMSVEINVALGVLKEDPETGKLIHDPKARVWAAY
jgi:hypothetical protein